MIKDLIETFVAGLLPFACIAAVIAAGLAALWALSLLPAWVSLGVVAILFVMFLGAVSKLFDD